MTMLALLRRLESRFKSARASILIKKYLSSGQKPWTEGYSAHKINYVNGVLHNDDLMNRFRLSQELPENYGFRLDERAIEYPWVLSRLDSRTNLAPGCRGDIKLQLSSCATCPQQEVNHRLYACPNGRNHQSSQRIFHLR